MVPVTGTTPAPTAEPPLPFGGAPPVAPGTAPAWFGNGLFASFTRAVRSTLRMAPSDGRAEPQVFLAAFGKHPGWDDHDVDLGIETGPLAMVKRVLYVNGIGENIDQGAWEKLPPEARLASFGHAFLWRDGATWFAGRLWSSRDRKGRSLYPMVLCAQCTGLPRPWVTGKPPPVLAQLERRCAATQSADDVRRVVNAARSVLRAAAAGAPEAAASSAALLAGDASTGAGANGDAADAPHMIDDVPTPGGGNPFNVLPDHPALGPDRRGILAVLYEVEREMARFLPARSSSASSSGVTGAAPRHLRVPTCGLPPFVAMDLWIAFLAARLSPAAPILALQPAAENWVDLIVGEPTSAELFCVRAGRSKMSFATDVQYKLDADFVKRANRFIDQHRTVAAPVGA